LPPRIYLPILAVVAVLFLAVMTYFLRIGLGNSGTVFGSANSQPTAGSAIRNVGGAPPGANTR
jgi:hypothetical protein